MGARYDNFSSFQTFSVNIKIVNQCRTTRFTEEQLYETFRNGVYRRATDGTADPAGTELPFTFDLLAACNPPGEVHYETAQLVVTVTDANGNLVNQHPHGVNADLSGGGVLDIDIFDTHIHVFNAAHVKATGPMTLDHIDLPGAAVGAPAAIHTPRPIS